MHRHKPAPLTSKPDRPPRFLAPQVDELPAQDRQSKERLLSSLTAGPTSRHARQVGGSTNFMIAAARLGLDVCCCGHVGDDDHGKYLLDCLQVRLL